MTTATRQLPISRVELMDAVIDAAVWHAYRAIKYRDTNQLVLADTEQREVDRLRRLRRDLMAGRPVEGVTDAN